MQDPPQCCPQPEPEEAAGACPCRSSAASWIVVVHLGNSPPQTLRLACRGLLKLPWAPQSTPPLAAPPGHTLTLTLSFWPLLKVLVLVLGADGILRLVVRELILPLCKQRGMEGACSSLLFRAKPSSLPAPPPA